MTDSFRALLEQQAAAQTQLAKDDLSNDTLSLLLTQLQHIEGVNVTESGINSHDIHFQDGSVWHLRVGRENATLSYKVMNLQNGQMQEAEQALQFPVTDGEWYGKFERAIKQRAKFVSNRITHIRNTLASFDTAGFEITNAIAATDKFSPTAPAVHLCSQDDNRALLIGRPHSVSVINPDHITKPWDLGEVLEGSRLDFSFRLATKITASTNIRCIADYASRQPARILNMVVTRGASEKALTQPSNG